MGYAEDYLDQFNQWFNALNEHQQQIYNKQFPEPRQWQTTKNQTHFNSIFLWAENGTPAYSQEKLLQASITQEYIFFWGNQPDKDNKIKKTCLSQWWRSDFQVNTESFCCVEQYMMSEKARLFEDQDSYQKIMLSKSQEEIKTLGRQVKNFDGKIWDKAKYTIVLNGNYYKFSQQKPLRDYLLETQNKILVEVSPHDKIWGIGLSEEDNNISNPACWKGQNLLGLALMEVRDEIRRVYQNHDLINWDKVQPLLKRHVKLNQTKSAP